jgi:hypothetical protein
MAEQTPLIDSNSIPRNENIAYLILYNVRSYYYLN